jgi:hypothetical protein
MTVCLLPISSPWWQVHWDSWPVFFFQLNTCSHSLHVTSSRQRGWVCHLQFLLALTIAAILRSKSCETHDHILLSQIWVTPNLEGQVPVFISTRNRVAQLYSQALGSLLCFLLWLTELWWRSRTPRRVWAEQRTEERTLTVTSKRQRGWPLVGNSGKHVTTILR